MKPRILTDAPLQEQGLSMFISRLGEPQGAQRAALFGSAETDHAPIGSVNGAQPFAQAADFQRLPVAKAGFRMRIELGARQFG
jgi:hypothetical protein